MRKLGLNFGVNEFTFQLGNASISAEIHYYTDNDRLLVSDVDGTVTKNDICGHIHNFVGKDYLH